MYKINLVFVTAVTILLFHSPSFGQNIFFDDFDSYTAGGTLACQNPIDWNIGCPCDLVCGPFISDTYSSSSPNSVVIVLNDYLTKLHGDVTSGKWEIQFMMYIPTGKAGYFNTFSAFDSSNPIPPDTYFAMEVYFHSGGLGELYTEDVVSTPFTWIEDTWQLVQVVVDLDLDVGEFWFNGTLVHVWQWTNGASSGLGPLQLAASGFWGVLSLNEMYFDNYWFSDWPIPVELTSFTASVNNSSEVILNWTTATELNNRMFEIERRTNNSEYETIGYVNGYGTTTEPQEYSYIDETVETGIYYYRLKQIDLNGSYEYFDAIKVDVKGPSHFVLGQNYPNPFNPSTQIEFGIPETHFVKLAVYNLIGEEVALLVNGQVEAGVHEVTFDASNLPSGAYFYKLQSGNKVEVKKMLLTK